MSYGIDTETVTLDNLIAGEVKTLGVDIKASEGAIAIGQVLEFDSTSNAFVKYTSGSAKGAYAVAAEAKTITAAEPLLAIVSGQVNINKLDATAQADPEIEGALLGSGIIPRNSQAA